jgi:hypothetical protein
MAPVKLKKATFKQSGPWMSGETNTFKMNCRAEVETVKVAGYYDIPREQLGIYNKLG